MKVIKVENLTRQFEQFVAVDSISFQVEDGELFGLLGPNGAGKTTTINMLATLIPITSGRAEVAGYNVTRQQDKVRRHIGIVFQEPALDTKLTGRENMEFHAMMYGIARYERIKRIDQLLDLVELQDKADVLVEKYSGGMKRRLEIARGLIHQPKVLFLDEPTLGLDAQTRRHIRDYIKKLNREKKVTIILTTHYMEEADYLCKRIAIIDHGKIIILDKPNHLKNSLGGDIVSLGVKDGLRKLAGFFKSFIWVKEINLHNNTLHLTLDNGERRIPELIQIANQNNINVNCVNLHKPSLEDVFIHFTGKTIREDELSQGEQFKELVRRRMRK